MLFSLVYRNLVIDPLRSVCCGRAVEFAFGMMAGGPHPPTYQPASSFSRPALLQHPCSSTLPATRFKRGVLVERPAHCSPTPRTNMSLIPMTNMCWVFWLSWRKS